MSAYILADLRDIRDHQCKNNAAVTDLKRPIGRIVENSVYLKQKDAVTKITQQGPNQKHSRCIKK